MNCISLHQFWAALMQIAAKRIETRHWPTSYRGPLAIHAASAIHPYARDAYDALPSVRRLLGEQFRIRNAFDMKNRLAFGAIVCVVDLVDCIQAPALPGMLEQLVPMRFQSESWRDFGNFQPGRWLWLCDNVRPLREPLKVTGRQNLWPLPVETIERIRKRI